MNVELISLTKPFNCQLTDSPEDLISYCARVSNPENQNNTDTSPRLLKFLIKHKHWSPFEMVDMTLEIKTSRAIAAQILRHRSFSFQEFSQRYSEAIKMEDVQIRKQAVKNRQSSTDEFKNSQLLAKVREHTAKGFSLYKELIKSGAAKESARMILPLTTETTMYMKGSIRSWIHYIDLRVKENTQKEHRDIALKCKKIFIDHFPNVADALWKDNDHQPN
jgi:thymidylate synthase (FAD)|tara:strand:- start:19 stop:678 length:660 start_codon:yes stop_codon:yes gene_type:complete